MLDLLEEHEALELFVKKKQIEFEVKSKENINTLLVYMN